MSCELPDTRQSTAACAESNCPGVFPNKYSWPIRDALADIPGSELVNKHRGVMQGFIQMTAYGLILCFASEPGVRHSLQHFLAGTVVAEHPSHVN